MKKVHRNQGRCIEPSYLRLFRGFDFGMAIGTSVQCHNTKHLVLFIFDYSSKRLKILITNSDWPRRNNQ